MMKYLAGVLSVIAVGVMLVAYALLAPRASATPGYIDASAMQGYSYPGYASPYSYQGFYGNPAVNPYGAAYGQPPVQFASMPAASSVRDVRAVETVSATPVRQRTVTRTIDRTPRRNWKKTALVIGGSSAAGAGVGALVGGKKGALIGAAIGGGASALYESRK